MRSLIVAANSKPPNAELEIRNNQRYRIDYLELANRMSIDYVDYDNRESSVGRLRRMEELLRIDYFWSRQLAKYIREEGFKTIFSLSERVGIPLSHMMDRRINHIVMMHHPMSKKKITLLKTTRTAKRWDRILVFSHAEADALASELGIARDRVRVFHFPIDIGFHHPNSVPQENDQEGFVFSIGLSHRDYPTLLKALRKLPNVPCQICGTSAWVEHRAGYEDADIPENVLIKHYDHPEVIREVYDKCRFVVIPIQHKTTQWSAGAASVLQPQAMGKPVIATRTPGLADYVLDGETGILVEGGNPDATAEAIDYLWNNPERAAEMGQRASKWVQENFSLEKWLVQVEELLEEVAMTEVAPNVLE